jgi:hypothetical protein
LILKLLHQRRFDAIAQEMNREPAAIPFLVLDCTLRIRASNLAYEQATLRGHDELLGQFLFDVFPDDPHDPQATGTVNLATSLETAMRSGHTHNMWVQRYDIRDPCSPDTFLPKVWGPTNSPLLDHGELLGVVHRVEEITDLKRAVCVLTDALESGHSWSLAELLHTLAAVSAAENARHRDRQQALIAENEQLRRAIDTRDTIGQAKGLVMHRFGIDADHAFALLRRLSQSTNTPVRDLACEIVAVHNANPADPD